MANKRKLRVIKKTKGATICETASGKAAIYKNQKRK